MQAAWIGETRAQPAARAAALVAIAGAVCACGASGESRAQRALDHRRAMVVAYHIRGGPGNEWSSFHFTKIEMRGDTMLVRTSLARHDRLSALATCTDATDHAPGATNHVEVLASDGSTLVRWDRATAGTPLVSC